MQDRFDGLKIGMLITEAFLNQGNINSSAIGKEYNLNVRTNLTAQSVGVLNVGNDDDTTVFEIIEPLRQTRGSLNVEIQDQFTDLVDFFFCRNIRDLVLAQPTIMDSYNMILTDASLVTVGNYVGIQENSRSFQAKILSKNGNTITLDTPIDYSFTSSAYFKEKSPNLNVDGSTTPVVFTLEPIVGVSWDITRILFQMVLASAGSDALFGNLTALTKGIVLRKTDGIAHTIFNAKTNGDLALRMYDLSYTDRATPSQTYGLRGRRSFNGFDKNGVTVRLNGNDEERLEIIVQDNLSTLTEFRVVAQGHVVE